MGIKIYTGYMMKIEEYNLILSLAMEHIALLLNIIDSENYGSEDGDLMEQLSRTDLEAFDAANKFFTENPNES